MLSEKKYSPFYSSFLSLCTQKGVAPSVAARDSGISSGAPTAWKNGAVPKPAQREKLCSYFGVSDEVLLGYAKVEKTPTQEGELNRNMIDPAFFRVMQDANDRGYTPEDIQMALDFLDRARRRDQK